MIKNYEIKKVNGEEVLYLFLDFSLEFAKVSPTKEKTTINKEINNYINKKRIKFNGRKIMLMASGLLLGVCLLKSPLPKEIDSNNLSYTYTTSLVTLDDNIVIPEKQAIEEPKVGIKKSHEEKSNISNNTITKVNSSNRTPTSSKKTTVASKKTPAKKVTTPTKTTAPTKKNNSSSITKNTTTNKTSTVKKTTSNTAIKTMITVNRSNGSLINLELEEYVTGVVAAEMPASFHIEALKAQAVAARTYALKAKENNTRLTDTESTQSFKDARELKKLWGNNFNTYYNKVKSAVKATEGLVMKYNGSLINAYYYSTSNGYSEDAKVVFGSFPYLKSVSSEVDKKSPTYLRTVTFTYENISNQLGIPVTPLSNIKITKNSSKRVDTIVIDNNTYSGVLFRKKLGLRSTDFDIDLGKNIISITTRGYGHGVGMSQYGAYYYAKNGYSYTKILKHYYTGIVISKI